MTKIMLVEDDKSLREIYGVRLLAEGYDIVSAADGEEALAMAIKERPVLIVTDVMMPKISGFDMLDILRSTTETKNIKVIVMTALGSEEQRLRGEQLGADRYLVKSQVGIEDVVRTVHEVLGDRTAAPAAPASPAVNRTAPTAPAPAGPTPGPQPSTQRTMAAVPTFAPASSVAAPVQPPFSPIAPASHTPVPVGRNRVIQPLNSPSTARVDINELLDRELAKEAGLDAASQPAPQLPIPPVVSAAPAIPSQPPAAPPAPTGTDDAAGTPAIQIDAQGNVSMPPTSPAASQPPVPPPPVR